MYKPSESLRPRRLAALTGVTLVAVVGLLLQLPLGASAGLAPGGIKPQAGETPARPVPPAPATAVAPKPAPGAYRLRCWQFGRLLFDEGPVSLAADYPIEVLVGPEFVTGSTRMKSGNVDRLR